MALPARNVRGDVELSVVVPCYDEEPVLSEFHRRASATCGAVADGYELIFVDDGSRDRSWDVMTGLADRDPHVICVSLSRNHGHQLALTAGLSIARGARILVIDADLQDPPELLSEMWKRMDAGTDVVYGQRHQRAGESTFKLMTARTFYRLLGRLTDTPIPPDTGDFRLMSRRVVDALLAMPEHHRFMRGMVTWVGFRQEALVYDREARYAGATKYPLGKMLRFAIDAVTGFSLKPLRLAGFMGLCSGGVALLLAAYSLVSWFRGGTVSGWTSLMAGVSLLSSVQLIVLGIIGEYLGRIFQEVKRRPLFVIDRIVRGSEAVVQARSDESAPSVSRV